MLQGKVEKVLDCGKNGKSGKGSIYIIVGTYAMTVSQCSPKSHSLKRRSSSSAPSGPISYGFDRIKLHQVQVMSPVLLIHPSQPSTAQVLEGIIQLCAPWEQFRERILLSAWQEKKCKTMQHMQNPDAARLNHSLSDERLEKTRAMTRVTVHPSSMWLSQTVQLILWLVLSRWRRHKVLSVRQVKHPMGSTGMSPSHFTSLFFPAYSLSEKIIQNKTLLLLMYYIYMYIYTHNFIIYGMYYVYIYMCV